MSKVLRTVGKIAGVVASVAAIIPGGQAIAAAAAAVAAISSAAGQLTASPPRAVGQVQGFLIGANNPLPYLMGEAYTEGVEVHRVGYGGEVDDVKNPYAFLARVLSCCGPIEDIGPSLVNYSTQGFSGSVGSVREATGYYENYLWIDEQLGARPESSALGTPSGWGTPTNWSSAHKLSGFAAVAWSLQWSKKGKRWPGGQIFPLGKVPKGVKVYDPRLDSTFPGGSGSQRIDDESTWAWSDNPALHFLTYAYGRMMNGKPIFGVRLFDPAAINLAQCVAWANVCDANSWSVNGTIFEPGDKWNNLKRIAEAGGAVPVPGAVLGVDYQSPRTSLYTVTRDDLAGPVSARTGKGWRDRHNVLVPRFRSPAHQWSYQQAERVENSDWITADGEEKLDERQWDLVTGADQVTELATYDLWQRREAGPIVLPCKPHMRLFRPGQCLTLAAELGAHPSGQIKAVIRRRAVDPVSGVVTLTLEQETDAKHTAALGLTGTAPPTVTFSTPQEIEEARALNGTGPGELLALITGRAMVDADPADGLLQASDTTVTIETHTARYADKEVSVTGASLTLLDDGTTTIASLDPGAALFIYYDDATRVGGAVTFKASEFASVAYTSPDHPARHYVGFITKVATGDPPSAGGGATPPGFGDEWSGETP
jgi:hypothetical protein